MFKKIWPRAVDDLEKLIYFSECQNLQLKQSEEELEQTLNYEFFLLDYISEERKHIAFNTQ